MHLEPRSSSRQSGGSGGWLCAGCMRHCGRMGRCGQCVVVVVY